MIAELCSHMIALIEHGSIPAIACARDRTRSIAELFTYCLCCNCYFFALVRIYFFLSDFCKAFAEVTFRFASNWPLPVHYFSIHLRATRAVFAPENIVIIPGINEFKLIFFVLRYFIVLVYTEATVRLNVCG